MSSGFSILAFWIFVLCSLVVYTDVLEEHAASIIRVKVKMAAAYSFKMLV
jgi:hypothetical protein